MGNPKITKVIVQQFETLRQSGKANMANAREVKEQAGKLGLGQLWDFMVDDEGNDVKWNTFTLLKTNYQFFIEEFGVNKDGK